MLVKLFSQPKEVENVCLQSSKNTTLKNLKQTILYLISLGPEVVGVVNVPFTKLLTAPDDTECVNSLHSCLFLQHPSLVGNYLKITVP